MSKELKTDSRLRGNFQPLRPFFDLAKPDVRVFFISSACLLSASLLEGISIGLIIPLLDMLMHGGSSSIFTRVPFADRLLGLLPEISFRYVFVAVIGGIMVATIAKSLLIFYSNVLTSSMSRDCEHLLRTKIFDRYLTFSKTFFDNNKIGHLYNLALSQVLLATEVFPHINSLLLNFCMASVYFGMMLFISWKLTLVSLLMLPCFYVVIRSISKRILVTTKKRFEIDQEMSSGLYDVLSNITLIRSYTNEAAESERFRRLSDSSRMTLHSIWKKILIAPHAQEVILSFFMTVLVTACVFVFLKGGSVSLAVFLSFFVILRRFSLNLNQLGSRFAEVMKALTPMRQVVWLFEDGDKQFLTDGHTPFAGLKDAITFRDVQFGYTGIPILNGVSLCFPKGRMTALVGPSGAGKTTIIQLVARFYDVTSGNVLFDGVDVRDFRMDSLRRRIAIVDQNISIFNDSIRANILYGIQRAVPDKELEEVAEKAYLSHFVATLPKGYDTLVGDRGVRLSGGEKQRIAIARAILKDPEIFIFDEATSLLDMETEYHIQKAIEKLSAGRTVIVIAHRLSTIKNADRIFMIEAGRVTEQGVFRELIHSQGRFQRYWELQGVD